MVQVPWGTRVEWRRQTLVSRRGDRNEEIEITPVRGALCADRHNFLDVLVTIRAPRVPEEHERERPPVGIALVVDRSGSMEGAPLEMVKRCCEYVVQQLRDDDILALIQFDDAAQVIREAAPLSDRSRVLSQIREIEPGADTNLCDGYLAGARQLVPYALDVRLQRVIVISDGYPSVGVRGPTGIRDEVRALRREGVTTSTIGLGEDIGDFLLREMAEAGQGNHYYAATPEDLLECFEHEMDRVLRLWRRDAVLDFLPVRGVVPRLTTPHMPELGVRVWQLPDVALGSEVRAVVRLSVVSRKLDHPEGLLTVVFRGRDSTGRLYEVRQTMEPLPVLSEAAYGTISRRPGVARRVLEAEVAETLFACRKPAFDEDWETVDALIGEVWHRCETHTRVMDIVAAMSRLAARREKDEFIRAAIYASRFLALPRPAQSEGKVLEG